MERVGTKRAVWERRAEFTAGGLTRADLMQNRSGKIVSKKKHMQALQNPVIVRQAALLSHNKSGLRRRR